MEDASDEPQQTRRRRLQKKPSVTYAESDAEDNDEEDSYDGSDAESDAEEEEESSEGEAESKETTELRFIRTAAPDEAPTLIRPREYGVRPEPLSATSHANSLELRASPPRSSQRWRRSARGRSGSAPSGRGR